MKEKNNWFNQHSISCATKRKKSYKGCRKSPLALANVKTMFWREQFQLAEELNKEIIEEK